MFLVIAFICVDKFNLLLNAEFKEIPYTHQKVCDRTYYKSHSVSNPSYDSKGEFNLNERTTDFSTFMSQEIYEKKTNEMINWAYGHYQACIEEVAKVSYSKNLVKGYFPYWCEDYANCGGGLVSEVMWKKGEVTPGHVITLRTSSGYEKFKFPMGKVEESGNWNTVSTILFLLIYFALVFGWRYVSRKLEEILD